MSAEAISGALIEGQSISHPEFAFHWTGMEALPSILQHGLLTPVEARRRRLNPYRYNTSSTSPEIGFMTTQYSSYAERFEVGIIVNFDEERMVNTGSRQYHIEDRNFSQDEMLGLIVRDRDIDASEIFSADYSSAPVRGTRDVSAQVEALKGLLVAYKMEGMPIFGTSGVRYF